MAEEFPTTEFVFRGQRDSQWRLLTSYDRYWGGTALHDAFFVERMVAQFRSGVTRFRLKGPPGGNLNWLEYARHHGLPAPLLDFSWSPFVALFFAFDGVREESGIMRSAAVYCLNLNQLAKEIAREHLQDPTDPRAFGRAIQKFLHEGASHFETGFPEDRLLFLRYPSPYTRRMHVQLGTFLYSTIQFGKHSPGAGDLDEHFNHMQEGFNSPCLPNEDRPVLLKINLPHAWVSKVFSRLEIMGIAGSSMYLSAEGVARDVYNSFNFHPRAAFLRDS
jgi:hypothetical protein